MSGWAALERELDAWHAAGRTASLWWRDDDAVEPTAALDRLVALGRTHGVPLALAVVPAEARAALVARVDAEPRVTPLQHGYAHKNHAAEGSKNGELGPARPLAVNLGELAQGWQRMGALFGARALPVLVPPWNRIDPALVPHLAALGFRGLSCFGARQASAPAPGLVQVNSHLDIVAWRAGRGFVGEAKALGELVAHLGARRLGRADPDEPTGLLTHHLVHDEAGWAFVAALLARSVRHPAVRWLEAREAFRPARAPAARDAAAEPGGVAGQAPRGTGAL